MIDADALLHALRLAGATYAVEGDQLHVRRKGGLDTDLAEQVRTHKWAICARLTEQRLEHGAHLLWSLEHSSQMETQRYADALWLYNDLLARYEYFDDLAQQAEEVAA